MESWLQKASEWERAGEPFVIATVTDAKGSSPRDAGAKMLIALEKTFGTIGGGKLEQAVIEDARASLRDALARTVPYPLCFRSGQCCGGAVDVFFEVVGVGPRLYLFGAGHVGQAVSHVLAKTPFQVHVADSRPEWLDHPDLSPLAIRHGEPWQSFCNAAYWSKEKTFVAIMTHDHALDEDLVFDLVKRPMRYLGLIGSQTKWQRMRRRLKERGLSDADLERVECPLGLPIGGKMPQEVAISLAARLLEIHHHDRKPS